MKNFEVVGHVKAFDNPKFREKINSMVEDSGETFEIEDDNGNKKTMHIVKLKPEIKQALNEYYLVRFHKVFASKDLIEKAHLATRDIFTVKSAVLYNDRGLGYKWDEPVQLLLLNDETGECITMEYFKKFTEISKIGNAEKRDYELDKLTVDRRSVIEYKDGDRIVEAVVLDMNILSYIVIDRSDFKDLVHDVKTYDEISKKVIDKKSFVKTIGILDISREEVISNIIEKCK